MHYKYLYILIYIWSKFKAFDFSGSENDVYFGTEGVLVKVDGGWIRNKADGFLLILTELEHSGK
jgi:hypothetical protein